MANSPVKPAICVPAMLYLILAILALITMAVKNCGALCLLFKVLDIYLVILVFFKFVKV